MIDAQKSGVFPCNNTALTILRQRRAIHLNKVHSAMLHIVGHLVTASLETLFPLPNSWIEASSEPRAITCVRHPEADRFVARQQSNQLMHMHICTIVTPPLLLLPILGDST